MSDTHREDDSVAAAIAKAVRVASDRGCQMHDCPSVIHAAPTGQLVAALNAIAEAARREQTAARPAEWKPGDIVRHKPTGELWTILKADEEHVYPAGWPESCGKRADCEYIATPPTPEPAPPMKNLPLSAIMHRIPPEPAPRRMMGHGCLHDERACRHVVEHFEREDCKRLSLRCRPLPEPVESVE